MASFFIASVLTVVFYYGTEYLVVSKIYLDNPILYGKIIAQSGLKWFESVWRYF